MKKVLATAGVLAIAGVAAADSVTVDYNIDQLDNGLVLDSLIALPALASIDSISIDLAQTWGGDLQITLTSPSGDLYTLMNGEIDQTGDGNFDMGLVEGDSSLGNVAPYNFVQSGGFAFGIGGDATENFAAPGTWNANTWGVGGVEAAGDWNLVISDTAGGDPTSVGSVTINYTIPAPGAIALLGLAGLAGGRRRRA